MATSTTLKLPDELKQRIVPLAQAAGKTPHAWMIETLQLHATLSERRADFVAEALEAAQEVDSVGRAYPAEAVHLYLSDRVAGRRRKRPKPVKW